MTYAWHFVGNRLRDGRPVPRNGVWLEHQGPIEICARGLHASLDPFDALQYAPGPILCLVEVDGVEVQQDDKLVCRRRKIVARMDATKMLRYFSQMQALSVVDKWDAPEVVLDYLMTGDESLREVARAAARDAWVAGEAAGAAGEAAWAAARAAAGDAWAAGEAAGDAARNEFTQLVHECFQGPMQAIRWMGNK